jgi:hypothetical protein
VGAEGEGAGTESEIGKTGALPHWMEEGRDRQFVTFYPLHFLKLQFIVMLFYDLSKFAGGCYLQMLGISAASVSHRQSLASAHAMTFRTFLFFCVFIFF